MYLVQLANSQLKQFMAFKNGKGVGGNESRAPNADAPGEPGERL